MRADSFVVETDVHFPTDINLLWDAMRKLIEIIAGLCDDFGVAGWRQSAYHLRQFKKLLSAGPAAQALDRPRTPTSGPPSRRTSARPIATIWRRPRPCSCGCARPACNLRVGQVPAVCLRRSTCYLSDAERQIDQIRRRVLCGETIPHAEKVFSLFERHTEWISKGKAGVPVELGLRVAVVEDQYRFILHHQVMQQTTDDQVAVALIDGDPGALSHHRQRQLRQGLPQPGQSNRTGRHDPAGGAAEKGKLSQVQREREHDPEFIRLRHQHSAVESAINALEVHGLDRCPDHGIDGFKRYVALAVVARNIQRLGAILRQQEAERQRGPYRLAA